MALADEIRAIEQKIALEVKIAGRTVANVLSVSASHGFDQTNSQASIAVATTPSGADEGAPVECWAGYNGQTALIFRGELSGVSWAYYPAGRVLDARSILWRVALKWGGGAYEYTAQDDAAVIRNILEKYGIPSTAANIESSAWELGVIQPVPFADGDTGQALIDEIDELAGYKTFTIASGVILRRRVSGKAAPSALWTFQKGVDILAARRVRSLDGIVNHAIVRGLTYEDLEVTGEAAAPNAYIPNPPGEIAHEVQSDLIEDNLKAAEIAARIVADRNRRPEHLELTVIGNPLIQPGATVGVEHSELGITGARVFVESVTHNVSAQGFTTDLRTTGGNLTGYEPAAPLAQIAITTYLEAEQASVGATPTRRVVLVADGASSFDPDGQPLTYAWTIAPDVGTATPDAGAEPVHRAIITGDATALTVTLVVTDTDGLTGTASEVVPIAAGVQRIENIFTAEGTLVAASIDGQQTWNEQTLTSGAASDNLAPIGPLWGMLWGADNGHLYASFDALLSTPVDLGAPHGAVAVTAVWVHETDSTRLWAAFADGAIYAGALDVATQSATWSAAGTVPAGPVVEIRESYGTLGELRATAGENEYYSTDAGATWSIGVAGGSGAVASRMAAGFDTNAVAFTTGADGVLYEGGGAPSITPAPTGGIRGLSFGYRVQELYAADGDNPAHLYRSGADFSALAEVGTAAGLAQINHVIRSGNEDGIVYMAAGDGTAGGGVIKSLRMEAPWYARQTGARQVHMVGYSAGVFRKVEAVLLVPASANEPAGSRGLWVLRAGLWAQQNGTGGAELPLVSTTAWASVAADPFNPQRWLLVGTTPTAPLAYLTEDAGLSWAPISLPSAGGGAPGGYSASLVAFSATTPGEWLITGHSRTGFGVYFEDYYWRGSSTTVADTAAMTGFTGLGTTGTGPIASLVAGASGDFLLAGGASGGTATLWRIPAGSAEPAPLHDMAGRVLWLDRAIGSNDVLGVATSFGSFGPFPDQEELFTTGDYATTAPTSTSEVVGQSVAIAGGAAFGAGRDTGTAGILAVRKVADPFSSPVLSTLTATTSADALGEVRSDRQTQTALAVRVSSTATTYLVSSDAGATWGRVAGPPVVAANLLTTHEVVST